MTVKAHPTLFGGASVQGATHITHNMPNQDFFGGAVIGPWTVIAVADGHGARAHFRSDRGSRFAIKAVHQTFKKLSAAIDKNGNSDQRLRRTFAGFPDLVVKLWREMVQLDLQRDPIANIEGAEPEIAYGSTCITACLGPDFSFFAQVGDGDLVVIQADGVLVKPLPDDEGLTGQQTFSLCQSDASRRFRTFLAMGKEDLATPGFVLVATDGLGKSFPRGNQFFDIVRHLADLSSNPDMEKFSRDIGPWLREVSDHGAGDDATVMVFRHENRAALTGKGRSVLRRLTNTVVQLLR